MECPAGQFCFNQTYIVIVVVIILFVLSTIYFLVEHNKQNTKKEIDNIKKVQSSLLNSVHSESHNSYHIVEPVIRKVYVIPSEHPNTLEQEYETRKRYYDPLTYPEKRNPYFMPINVPTRGYAPNPQQIGILTNEKHDKIIPLFGSPTYSGSSKWKYYTTSERGGHLKLPLASGGKDCTNEYGCNEIYDSDTVSVPSYGEDFKVTIYPNDLPKYIPY